MGIWQFVIVYLVVFVLLQLVVYRLVRGNDVTVPSRSSQQADPTLDETTIDDHTFDDRLENTDSRDDSEQNARLCPNCGAKNARETVYTYCRNCAEPIGH